MLLSDLKPEFFAPAAFCLVDDSDTSQMTLSKEFEERVIEVVI
jgi:hypothetical protein